MKQLSPTAQKILLLLASGMTLGFSRTPGQYSRVIKNLSLEWQKIERRKLYRAICRLYESKLVNYREEADGSISIALNREGREVVMRHKLDDMVISKPHRWDRKWRIVLFDIPEKQKSLRDTLRKHFKQLGLRKFQKSVFIHPYECRNEIDFIIEIYNARRYVRFIEGVNIDNELHFRKKFKLL